MKKLSVISEMISPSLTRKLFNMAKQYDDVIDFTLGDPDIHPHHKIKESGCCSIQQGRTRYSQNAGLLELRNVISQNYLLENNLYYNPANEIIVTVGGMEGIYLSLLTLIDKGDEVIIPSPYWINYSQMVLMCGGNPVIVDPISHDDLNISIPNIRSAITPKTKVIIINSPSNPSGLVIKEKDLIELANLANEFDLYVISDEVYKRLIYGANVFSSISTMENMKKRTLVVNSLSKEFCMTGWRVGYVVGPQEIISVMTMLQENVAACAPLPSQYAAIEALNHRDEYSKDMINEFTKRKNVLVEEIAKINQLSMRNPEATFYAMINIKRTGIGSEEFSYKLLQSAHVAVVPGITYGNSCEGFIRIAFTVKEELISAGVRRIGEFVRNL